MCVLVRARLVSEIQQKHPLCVRSYLDCKYFSAPTSLGLSLITKKGCFLCCRRQASDRESICYPIDFNSSEQSP
ncbi:hypothetical protein Y1Q_0009538 [Alligator mississippiensis]|uniref:Uncharacterized protein n=1 Tax=Alligator mississippiensis TaxID=8496 RepID=A0A151NUG5_ALLMI|nr:hypothetical protein Y1Q_0009538 [Alligator mississippiensis]